MGRKLPKVNPKLSYYALDSRLPYRAQEVQLRNTELHLLVKKLVAPLEPSMKGECDTRWFAIYLPLKRGGREIAVPMSVVLYKGKYFVAISKAGHFRVGRGGQEIDPFYRAVITEATRLLSIVKKEGVGVVSKLVPYDYRKGRVKGKYIVGEGAPKTMLRGKREEILKQYQEHSAKNLKAAGGCSLNEYLNTAAVCYAAAYGRSTEGMEPQDAYWAWADKRHGGMLDIKNRDSRRAFSRWYHSGQSAGSHPFEIVFSWRDHGIHMYPPTKHNEWRYGLRVTNLAYAEDFIKMLRGLVEKGVPFQAYDLRDVLDYLTGEAYFTVNEYSDLSFDYIPGREYRKKYFKKITWEPLELPKWRRI